MHKPKRKSGNRLYLLALVPFLLIIGLFELMPLCTVIVRSFMPYEAWGFTLENYSRIFSQNIYRQAVFNSIFISLLSAVVGIAIASAAAKATTGVAYRLKTFFMSVLNMTSNFGGLQLAFAYIIMFGNVGIFVTVGQRLGIAALANINLYSAWGLIAVYIYFQIPLATMLLIPSFEILNKTWRESVLLLGGKESTYWFKVAIPCLCPSIFGTLSVLFANTISAYVLAYALLQNNFSLLPIRISEQFVGDVVQNREFGSALAVVLMVLMVVAIQINQFILKKTTKWVK